MEDVGCEQGAAPPLAPVALPSLPRLRRRPAKVRERAQHNVPPHVEGVQHMLARAQADPLLDRLELARAQVFDERGELLDVQRRAAVVVILAHHECTLLVVDTQPRGLQRIPQLLDINVAARVGVELLSRVDR